MREGESVEGFVGPGEGVGVGEGMGGWGGSQNRKLQGWSEASGLLLPRHGA